jgi:ABC-type multidrug transport system permease subunit
LRSASRIASNISRESTGSIASRSPTSAAISPNAVMSIGFVILFPVTFMSNIFVDPATMHGWLRAVSGVNPVSHLVTATWR